MIYKGLVVEVLPAGVRIRPYGGGAVTPVLPHDGIELALNDIVIFAFFDDQTGTVLSKM